MIISSIEELQQYVSINASGDITKLFTPYINKALRDYIEPLAGDIADLLKDEAPSTTANYLILNKARTLLQDALANLGVYRSLSIISVQITDYGISVEEGTSTKPVEAWRMKDLKRQLLNDGFSALDRLLKYLNDNPTVFTDYQEQFASDNKKYIITDAADFQKYQNINHSTLTYNTLKPVIAESIDRYISSLFCSDYLENLKSTDLEGYQLEAQNLIKKAIAAFTISHASQFSCFKATPDGMVKKYDVLPYEQVTTHTSTEMSLYSIDRDHVGNAYVNKAIELIKAYPTDFTMCNGDVIIDNSSLTTAAGSQIYNTKSTLQL